MLKEKPESADARPMGFRGLAAIGINLVIGAGFFVLPASFFAQVGAWTPLLILLVGAGLLPVGLCFAELGSRYSSSGGPYLYCREAFGPYVGFQVNWLTWVTRVISHASVLVAIALSIGGALNADPSIVLVTTVVGVTLAVTLPNIYGVRTGSATLQFLTVLKFLPIFVLILTGLLFVDIDRLVPPALPQPGSVASGALLIAFALSGFEMLTVPSGEAREPTRSVPRALMGVMAVSVATVALANVVCIGLLGDVAAHPAPVADVARILFGFPGLVLVSVAVVVAGVGHNASSIIAASRLLSSAAEQRDAPAFLGRRNPRFGTPVGALLVTAFVVVALALSGSYEFLAATSAATRLVVYAGVALATLRLRGRESRTTSDAPLFQSPLHKYAPWLALLFCAFLLSGLTGANAVAGLTVFAGGVIIHAFMRRSLAAGRGGGA